MPIPAMIEKSHPGLFPLPLTPFEIFMLTDDRPDYPMTFPCQLKFSGQMDREAFASALDEALSRHPLFCALVDRRSGPCWRLADGLKPRVDWDACGVPLRCPDGERIDLTREVGLRIWVREGDGTTELTLQVQHCSSDGVGVGRFLGDLLAAYGARTGSGGRSPVLPPVDAANLLKRGHFEVVAPSEPVSRGRAAWEAVREAGKWLWWRPTPLCAPNSRPPTPADFPGIHSHTFDEVQTRRLRSAATQQHVSLNDLFLRDLFHAIVDWNERIRPARPGSRLRINMPINLRSRIHNRMPAANAMSFAFLTRRLDQCRDRRALLNGIRRETDVIRRCGLGMYFLGGVACSQRVPGLLRLAVAGHRCFSTAVCSHMGEASRRFGVRFPREAGNKVVAGNVILENVTATPPVRPKTRAAFTTSIYAGTLTVSVRCDPHLFAAEDSRRLLGLYVEKLTNSMTEAC